jgi:hypothetical protein
MQIDAAAPVVLTTGIDIAAPRHLVSGILFAIAEWPSWNDDIRFARVDGPVATGTRFRWKSGPLAISSRVEEVVPGHRIGWTGRTIGLRARHVWTLTDDGGGTRVRTDESMTGALPRLLAGPLRRSVQQSLDDWLARLKATAEASRTT